MDFRLPPDLGRQIRAITDDLAALARAVRWVAGLHVRFGFDTVTYAGGSRYSASTTVTHGLEKTPVVVFTQSQGIDYATRPTSVGGTTFQVAANRIDGSLPAASTEVGFYWLTIG